MKKVILFVILVLLSPIISAAENSNGEFSIATNSMFSFSESVSNHQKAQNIEELKSMIEENELKLNEESNEMKSNEKTAFENQNKMRNAIYALFSMESLIPAVGILVSDMANQFTNSINLTTGAETEILSRNSFSYFLFGGGSNAVNIIESEIISNKERISNLEEFKLRCGCSSEVQEILEMQIQIIKNEQLRLQNIIDYENSKKGLLSWVFE